MRPVVGVAIVGAGPYGLSVAAHLHAHGIRPRVFGAPMETWLRRMPRGMVLKSEGFAMNLSEPENRFTLGAFCKEHGLPYQDIGWPVPVETFAAYGEAFQQKFVPQVETTTVTRVERAADGFTLTLATGETFTARSLVMANGIRPFFRMPSELAHLPDRLASHSADHGDMSDFAGRRVAVLGGGASAMDVAASLFRAGAQPIVLSRRADVKFYSPMSFRSLRDRLLAPMTTLGPGWKKYLCVKVPDLFRLLPARTRARILRRYLGPSPAWSVRDIITAHVDLRLETTLTGAEEQGDGLRLTIDGKAGRETIAVDHLIAATGYEIDMARLGLLADDLRADLRTEGAVPVLSRHFESSIANLFFVGTQSAQSFGPMLRFVCGTAFAAARVAGRIAATAPGSVTTSSAKQRLPLWQTTGSSAQP